jgi:ATP adenylyltransferase/5',5'''-P-1,P-4-tetraphosphate phosphorylase II
MMSYLELLVFYNFLMRYILQTKQILLAYRGFNLDPNLVFANIGTVNSTSNYHHHHQPINVPTAGASLWITHKENRP